MVGYRVNSKKATRTLRECIQKGCLLNDEILKNGQPFGKDYFAELLDERATLDSSTTGLTTWKGAPDGKILKSDALVAKNCLNKKRCLGSTGS